MAEFGRFFFNDFGRIDFWRVKRRQMRLSWKFSLLNRYFSTTLLYQFFFDRTFFHILFFHAYFLKHFGCIWLILLMRFWQNRFLKGQTTSDGTEIFFSLLTRYFSTTLLYQFFFDRTFFHILFFYAYFLKHFGCIWLILLMRFWQIIFLKRQMTSDEAEIFFFHY